jgi:hypothetical protein
MNNGPLEGLLIVLVWVALALAYDQLGRHKPIRQNAPQKPIVIRTSRLAFHFSLRTLQMTTTLVSIVLVTVVYALK